MNKGITKSCPKCKKVLFRNLQIKGHGEFELKCPHCATLTKTIVKMTPDVHVSVVIV